MKTNINYNELVDHLVTTMNKSEPPFDTQAYQNYKEQVNKQRDKLSDNLVEEAYKIGYQIDTVLGKIIDQLDNIIEDDFDPDNVKCTIDDNEVDISNCNGNDTI